MNEKRLANEFPLIVAAGLLSTQTIDTVYAGRRRIIVNGSVLSFSTLTNDWSAAAVNNVEYRIKAARYVPRGRTTFFLS